MPPAVCCGCLSPPPTWLWNGNGGNLKLDESCISNPKLEISNWTAWREQPVQFEISNFGFEMQDSSNFKSPSLHYYPRVCSIFTKISLRTPPSLQRTPGERGIYRRDAENFGFFKEALDCVISLVGTSQAYVGCKEGRARRENPVFSLRLCGEFPFGCGFAALRGLWKIL